MPVMMRILVIDDDRSVGAAIEIVLRNNDCAVVLRNSSQLGIEAFDTLDRHDVVIYDGEHIARAFSYHRIRCNTYVAPHFRLKTFSIAREVTLIRVIYARDALFSIRHMNDGHFRRPAI